MAVCIHTCCDVSTPLLSQSFVEKSSPGLMCFRYLCHHCRIVAACDVQVRSLFINKYMCPCVDHIMWAFCGAARKSSAAVQMFRYDGVRPQSTAKT